MYSFARKIRESAKLTKNQSKLLSKQVEKSLRFQMVKAMITAGVVFHSHAQCHREIDKHGSDTLIKTMSITHVLAPCRLVCSASDAVRGWKHHDRKKDAKENKRANLLHALVIFRPAGEEDALKKSCYVYWWMFWNAVCQWPIITATTMKLNANMLFAPN